MRDFDQVWVDIQSSLRDLKQVETICQGSINDILQVTDLGVSVCSRRSRNNVIRFVSKKDFEYVWHILSNEGIYTLNNITGIIGKRAVTCAIMARLTYVHASCDHGRVSLQLKG